MPVDKVVSIRYHFSRYKDKHLTIRALEIDIVSITSAVGCCACDERISKGRLLDPSNCDGWDVFDGSRNENHIPGNDVRLLGHGAPREDLYVFEWLASLLLLYAAAIERGPLYNGYWIDYEIHLAPRSDNRRSASKFWISTILARTILDSSVDRWSQDLLPALFENWNQRVWSKLDHTIAGIGDRNGRWACLHQPWVRSLQGYTTRWQIEMVAVMESSWLKWQWSASQDSCYENTEGGRQRQENSPKMEKRVPELMNTRRAMQSKTTARPEKQLAPGSIRYGTPKRRSFRDHLCFIKLADWSKGKESYRLCRVPVISHPRSSKREAWSSMLILITRHQTHFWLCLPSILAPITKSHCIRFKKKGTEKFARSV